MYTTTIHRQIGKFHDIITPANLRSNVVNSSNSNTQYINRYNVVSSSINDNFVI